MDQLARDVLGEECDLDGRLAATGTADTNWVEAVLALPYFMKPGPKSLDRDDLFDWCAKIPPPSDPADRMASFMLLTAAALPAPRQGCGILLLPAAGRATPSWLRPSQGWLPALSRRWMIMAVIVIFSNQN